MPADALQWTELADFTPGIHSDYHGGSLLGSILQNGAAVVEDTYRCCADPSGALTPLPARTAGRTQALIATTYRPANPAMYLQDARVLTRLGSTTLLSPGSADGEGVIAGYSFVIDPAAGTAYRSYSLVRYYQQWQTAQPTLDLWWGKTLASSAVRAANIVLTPIRFLDGSILDNHIAWTVGTGPTDNPVGGAIPVAEQTLTTFGTDNTNGWSYLSASGNAYNWPKASDATVKTTELAMLMINCMDLIGHQGRLMSNVQFVTPFGAFAEGWESDKLAYQAPNSLGATPFEGIFGEENVSGISWLASISADELLIMRNRGGAYVIRGDVDSPTVSRLPFLESPHGVYMHPTATPMGLVYVTSNGVFVWTGGEQSDKLSMQHDGWTWLRHEQDLVNETYTRYRGRLEWWHPYVCLPNNYLFDSRTKAWWRLEATTANSSTPYNVYQTLGTTNKLYAFPYKIKAGQTTAWDVYDPAVLASSYSWKSQPLLETLERTQAYNEIRLVASNPNTSVAQTVVVTLTGFDEDGTALTPVVTTFTWTPTGNPGPVFLRKTIERNFQATYVQVKIAASAVSGAAPKVHRVSLGHRDAARHAKAT